MARVSFEVTEDDPGPPKQKRPTSFRMMNSDGEEKKCDDPEIDVVPVKPKRISTLRNSTAKQNKPDDASHDLQKAINSLHIAPETENNHLPTKSSRPFSFRSKGVFQKLCLVRNNKKHYALTDDEDEEEYSNYALDDDPVMAVFKSRRTQRVRFSLDSESDKPVETNDSPAVKKSIKRFMKGALFGMNKGGKAGQSNDEFEAEVAREIATARVDDDSEMVWENGKEDITKGTESVQKKELSTKRSVAKSENVLSFTESPSTRASVIKLLNKARRAQFVHYRYEYAVKCYMKALNLLTKAKYPDNHPTVVKTLQSLNNAHHSLSSFKNSANIVKMGIKYEDSGELVRALKMYTIAYRIRRDNLTRTHPSLVVLLNMLGSIQIKRGELEEAMQIYELALKDDPIFCHGEDNLPEEIQSPSGNLLARGVTYREMGRIYVQWNEITEALKMFHRSLDCVTEYKSLTNPEADSKLSFRDKKKKKKIVKGGKMEPEQILLDLENVFMSKSSEMELTIGTGKSKKNSDSLLEENSSNYDKFFPLHLEEEVKSKYEEKNVDYADVDVALTLHQIAQLHRAQGEYNLALAAYTVSLRGMKYSLGNNHPNIPAILGNIGNVQKEMGDMDAAFATYQEVLGIESYRFGLSHPDVAITLHNIATIDAARGNHDHALALYRQVLSLQRKLFGEDHMSVAVTSACMGDVYERLGDLKRATDCFDQSLRIKSITMGRHSLETARLLHKLGKISVAQGDFHLADSYLSRAVLIYRLNKLPEDDEWVVAAYRDAADIDAAITMGRGQKIDC